MSPNLSADHHDDVAGADRLTGLDSDFLYFARGLGVDVVLHLHGFEDTDGLTGLDLVANGDEHLDDGPLHRNGDCAGASATDGAAGGDGLGAGPPGSGC